MNSHLALVARIRSEGALGVVPGRLQLEEHLQGRMNAVGTTSLQEFAHVQRVAAATWGPERSSHFAMVLREARVMPKPPRNSRWKLPRAAIVRLPPDWRGPLNDLADRSEAGRSVPGAPIWSADYLGSVAMSLNRYVVFARDHGHAILPAGSDLAAYAQWLTAPANFGHGVSNRAAADYLARVNAGLHIVAPNSSSIAREFVARYWRERAEAFGAPTKTGNQLVGAPALYDLGFEHIETARARPMRGIRAATDFRNGLILAGGIALPQRARAISCLEFESTLWLEGDDRLHVRIPARMLKLPEDRKQGDPLDMIWHNARLAEALREYRRYYRPIFDGGTCLFPSVHATGQAISEKQIGRLTASLTRTAFGVAVPIHRFRDNAATDASENLTGGRLATAALLGHTDLGTGAHYDHSTARKAAGEFDDYIDRQRTAPVDLAL